MSIYNTFPAFPVNGLRKEIDRLFDEAFTTRQRQSAPAIAWMPGLEAREDATGFVFEFELPGVAVDDVEVVAEDGLLVVKGERRVRELAEGERVLVQERASGRFERRLRLPKSADATAIAASFTNGVLIVRVPKVAPAQPRRVAISTETHPAAPTN